MLVVVVVEVTLVVWLDAVWVGDGASLVGVVGVDVVLAFAIAVNLEASAVTLELEAAELAVLACVVAEAVLWREGLVLLLVAKMLVSDGGA